MATDGQVKNEQVVPPRSNSWIFMMSLIVATVSVPLACAVSGWVVNNFETMRDTNFYSMLGFPNGAIAGILAGWSQFIFLRRYLRWAGLMVILTCIGASIGLGLLWNAFWYFDSGFPSSALFASMANATRATSSMPFTLQWIAGLVSTCLVPLTTTAWLIAYRRRH